MRSRKVEPGAAVMRTRIQSESTCVPPVTAERSPPDSRMTGADSPVIAASLTEAMPSMTSPSDGMVSPASTSTMSPTFSARARHQLVVLGVAGRSSSFACVSVRVPPQRVGLRLAAAFGDRLGEVGEQHREPQPEDDLEREAEICAAGHEIAQEDDRGEDGHDLEHEHHRVLHQRPRVELREGRADRRHDDLGIEQRRGRRALARCGGFHRSVAPRSIRSRTSCRRSSRGARRWVRARAPGRR